MLNKHWSNQTNKAQILRPYFTIFLRTYSPTTVYGPENPSQSHLLFTFSFSLFISPSRRQRDYQVKLKRSNSENCLCIIASVAASKLNTWMRSGNCQRRKLQVTIVQVLQSFHSQGVFQQRAFLPSLLFLGVLHRRALLVLLLHHLNCHYPEVLRKRARLFRVNVVT